jgi:hypothetical protein
MKTETSNPSKNEGERTTMRQIYRRISLLLAVVFAAVGLLFLFLPNSAPSFFNSISPFFKLPQSQVLDFGFYQILAVGYMYLVTLLACLMFRFPENRDFTRLLIHAKSASSIISIGFFVFHQHYLIYLANAVVDGSIALGLLILNRQMKKTTA